MRAGRRRAIGVVVLRAGVVAGLLAGHAAAPLSAQAPGSGVQSGSTARLTDGDAPAVSGDGPEGRAVTLVRVDAAGGAVPGSAPLRPGDTVRLRLGAGDQGAGDAWVVVGAGGTRRVGAASTATTFRLTAIPGAPAPVETRIQVLPFTASTAISTLGAMDGAPCARVEAAPAGSPAPADPGLRLVAQRVTAFADVRIGNPVNEFYAEVESCVGDATAATGLAAIVASPAGALPRFTATLAACIAARAPLTRLQYALLRTESACR